MFDASYMEFDLDASIRVSLNVDIIAVDRLFPEMEWSLKAPYDSCCPIRKVSVGNPPVMFGQTLMQASAKSAGTCTLEEEP